MEGKEERSSARQRGAPHAVQVFPNRRTEPSTFWLRSNSADHCNYTGVKMEQQDRVAELKEKKRSRIKRFEELMRKLLIQINKSGAHGHGEVQREGGIDPECFHACLHAEGGEKQI